MPRTVIMDNNKTALRRELLSLRKAVSRKKLDISHLSHYPEFVQSKVVFCYVSAHGEVDTRELLEELLKSKTVVVPFCTDGVGNMICVKIDSPDDLTEGHFGILEPKNPVPFPKEQIDFAVVPGIAFDKDGYRLGYGKGYYDRFLADITPFKLGVCPREFFVSSLPRDEYDVKMNDVIII